MLPLKKTSLARHHRDGGNLQADTQKDSTRIVGGCTSSFTLPLAYVALVANSTLVLHHHDRRRQNFCGVRSLDQGV